MRGIKFRAGLAVGALAGILIAGCTGSGGESPEEGEAMMPQIDLERPAAVATATFALG